MVCDKMGGEVTMIFDKMVEKDSGVEGSVMSGGVGCLTGWPSDGAGVTLGVLSHDSRRATWSLIPTMCHMPGHGAKPLLRLAMRSQCFKRATGGGVGARRSCETALVCNSVSRWTFQARMCRESV